MVSKEQLNLMGDKSSYFHVYTRLQENTQEGRICAFEEIYCLLPIQFVRAVHFYHHETKERLLQPLNIKGHHKRQIKDHKGTIKAP